MVISKNVSIRSNDKPSARSATAARAVEMETTEGKTRDAMAAIDSGARSTTSLVATSFTEESKSEEPFARFPATPQWHRR